MKTQPNNKVTKLDSKKVQRWNKSIGTGDNTNTIDVEELSNGGYLVSISKEGKDKKGEWKYDNKKYFSQTNPLIGDEEEDTIDELTKSLLGENNSLMS